MKYIARLLLSLVVLLATQATAANTESYKALSEAGYAAEGENHFADAIPSFEAALELIPKDSTLLIADVCNSLLNCYFRLGQIDEALQYGQKLLEIDEESGIAEDLSSTLNNLAVVCASAKRFKLAKEYIQRSIEIERELNHDDKLAIRLGVLGELYANEGDYQQALLYLRQALDLDKEGGREAKVAIRLSQLGNTLLLDGQYAAAMPCLREADPLLRRFNNTPSLAMNLLSMGKLEYLQGHYNEAIAHISEALEITQANGMRQIEMNCNMELSRAYYKMHDLRSYDCLTRYIQLQDSVNSEQVQEQISNLEVQYQMKQKEQEIALDKVTIARQQQLYIGLAILLVMALVILFFVGRSLKLQRQNMQLRDNFYRLISHDLKNPALAQRHSLQQLYRYLDVIDTATMKQQLAHLSQDADAQVALLFDLLDWTSLQTGKMHYSPIRFDLLALAQEVATQHRGQASVKGISVDVSSTASDPYIMADRQLTASILRNLLNNAIKFSDAGQHIELSVADRQLTVADHGRGFDVAQQLRSQSSQSGTANEKGNALGLSLARRMAKLNHTELSIESTIGVGTTITLSFAE